MSTKLFAAPVGFTLALDLSDAKTVCVAAGRIQYECDLPDEAFQDVTAKALKGMPPAFQASLQAIMDKGMRGCVYPDPHGWVVIPLSSECAWLHDNATELIKCPRCQAEPGSPCVAGDKTPIYEGTAHRARVRVLVFEHPEVLDHSLTAPAPDLASKPWLASNAIELADCPHCNAPAGFPCEGMPEGVAHPERIASLVKDNPAALDHSLLK
jgi:hypothetical protein